MPTSQGESPSPAPVGPALPPGRTRLFVVLATVLAVLAAGYVVLAAGRSSTPVAGGASLADGGPALLFQNLINGAERGRMGAVPLGAPGGARSLTGLSCDRVHFAAGRGLCLTAGGGFLPAEYALVFGADFVVQHEIALEGLPSRTRVSPDGRYGATTLFITGHSYADAGFSTATTLIDMARGTVIANLEEFALMRDGRPFAPTDLNYWGVTFAADSNRFFATAASGGQTYLVEGDIMARRMTVGPANVECPSLSPDGTRIGFKKRVDAGGPQPVWRFHVLDLASGQETPLAETRSVDDQLEWLDDRNLLYGSADSPAAVFIVAADGSGEPRQYLSQALSPAVLREPLPDASLAGLVAGPQVTVAGNNLGVTAEAPASVGTADPVTHTLDVTNRGPGDATNVVVDDVVSGAGRITAAMADIPTGSGGYGCAVYPEQNRVRCDTARLPAGATWTVTITVSPTGPGAVGGQAIVWAAEPDTEPGDTIASVTTLITG